MPRSTLLNQRLSPPPTRKKSLPVNSTHWVTRAPFSNARFPSLHAPVLWFSDFLIKLCFLISFCELILAGWLPFFILFYFRTKSTATSHEQNEFFLYFWLPPRHITFASRSRCISPILRRRQMKKLARLLHRRERLLREWVHASHVPWGRRSWVVIGGDVGRVDVRKVVIAVSGVISLDCFFVECSLDCVVLLWQYNVRLKRQLLLLFPIGVGRLLHHDLGIIVLCVAHQSSWVR